MAKNEEVKNGVIFPTGEKNPLGQYLSMTKRIIDY